MSWLQRYLQRRYDLARGVDADLVAANRKRWKLSTALFCAGVLLGWLETKLPLPHALRLAADILALFSLAAGIALFHWAWQVDAFLSRPDPEQPPDIFKD